LSSRDAIPIREFAQPGLLARKRELTKTVEAGLPMTRKAFRQTTFRGLGCNETGQVL
jgi:hypothetical protein